MDGTVRVVKPKNYTKSKPHSEFPIITIGPNEEYGSIMLSQQRLVMKPGSNFANVQTRVAHFVGEVGLLQQIVESYDLKEGDDFSEKVRDVELIVVESHEPAYEGQDPKINPNTGEVLTSGGKEIYRTTVIADKADKRADKLLDLDQEPVSQKATQKANTEFASQ